MRRSRLAFFAGATLATLVVLAALAATLVALNGDAIRAWVEREAAERADVELRLEGAVGLRLSPRPTVRLADVSIRRNDGTSISARAIAFEPALGALLGGRAEVRAVHLDGPHVTLADDGESAGGVAIPDTVLAALERLGLERIEVTDATLVRHGAAGNTARAAGCDVSLREMHTTGTPLPAFTGEIDCDQLEAGDRAFGPLEADARSADGVLHLDAVTLELFGSEAQGRLQADLNGAQPVIRTTLTLDAFSLARFFEHVGADASARGEVDLRAELSLHGTDVDALMRSAAGTLSLSGRDVVLRGVDLDETIARFESSQSFQLVDLGAVFIAGPFGMVATQGYRFGSLVMSPDGESEIRTLRSDWTIEDGVAHTRDVAFATDRHRIAASGRVDFVNQRFDTLTIALLDEQGCASAEQTLDGPFERAGESGGGLVGLITGPTRDLLSRGAALFSGGRCEPFYQGSIAAPR